MKLFCCVRNVQYKIPHGTQDSNRCPYPLLYMDIFCTVNCERKYFYLTERSILLPNISAFNTDFYMHQNYYKQRKHIWPYIYSSARTIRTFININNHKWLEFRYEEVGSYWTINRLSNIFCNGSSDPL